MAKFFWDEIQKLAKAHHIEDPLNNLTSFRRFLEFWWSQKFNRPLKDPLLQEYTLEELTYEWLRNKYLDPAFDPRKDIEKQEQEEDDMAWIRARLEAEKQKKEASKPAEPEVKKEESPTIPDLPDISTKFE